MSVVHALAEIGGDEAVTAIRGFAIDCPVAYDRGLSRPEAVAALARAVPAEKRAAEMTAILRNPKATPEARREAVRQFRPLGRKAAGPLREAVAARDVAVQAMWELSRWSAPKRFASKATFPPPLKGEFTLGQLGDRLGLPVRLEGLAGLEREVVYVPANERLTLAAVFFATADLRGDTLGVIVTDEGVRVVPRAEAAAFYGRLPLDGPPE